MVFFGVTLRQRLDPVNGQPARLLVDFGDRQLSVPVGALAPSSGLSLRQDDGSGRLVLYLDAALELGLVCQCHVKYTGRGCRPGRKKL